MHQRICSIVLAASTLLLGTPLMAAAAFGATSQPSTQATTQPSAADVSAELEPELVREIDALLPKLAARDYRARDEARERLIEIGPIARESLVRFARDSQSVEARTNVELALRQIAESERLGPTLMSLSFRDGTLADACAAISRAASISVTPEPGAAWPRASVNLRRRPYWEVLRRTCEVFGAAPRLDLNNGRITLVPDAAWGKRPWQMAAGCLVVFESATRLARRDAELDVDFDHKIQMRFEIYTDPTHRGLTHLHYLNIIEARDEHGQSMIPDKPIAQGVGSGSGSFGFDAGVVRRAKLKGSTRLASFRGKAGLLVQTQAARMEFDDITTAKEMTREAAGLRLTVRAVERRPDGWAVRVVLVRAGCDDRIWEMARDLFNPMQPQLCDKKGNAEPWILQAGGRDGDSKTPDRVERAVIFLDTGGPEAAAKREPPAKLVWVLPAKTADVTIPIEFTDLPLP